MRIFITGPMQQPFGQPKYGGRKHLMNENTGLREKGCSGTGISAIWQDASARSLSAVGVRPGKRDRGFYRIGGFNGMPCAPALPFSASAACPRSHFSPFGQRPFPHQNRLQLSSFCSFPHSLHSAEFACFFLKQIIQRAQCAVFFHLMRMDCIFCNR